MTPPVPKGGPETDMKVCPDITGDQKTEETETDVEDYGELWSPESPESPHLSPISHSRLIWSAPGTWKRWQNRRRFRNWRRFRRPKQLSITLNPPVDIVRLCSEETLRAIIAEAQLANAMR